MLGIPHARYCTSGARRIVDKALRAAGFLISLSIISPFLQAATTPTTTQLTVSSSSVSEGIPVVFTVNVSANGRSVYPGQVKLCDASQVRCDGSAVLATAQISYSPTTIKTLLGVGTHNVYAMFVGTQSYAASVSTQQPVTILKKGKYSSSITVNAEGSNGTYQFSAAVTGHGRPAITGNVSFLDVSQNNSPLTSASLGSSVLSYGLGDPSILPIDVSNSFFSSGIAVADLNNDGVPDIVWGNTESTGESTYSSRLFVQMGDPSHPGQFLAPGIAYNTPYPYSFSVRVSLSNPILTGDFNGDGVPDIAVLLGPGSYSMGAVTQSHIEILFGQYSSPGNFPTTALIPIGNNAYSMTTADFNRDGLPDLAVTNTSDGTVTVLLSDSSNPGQFKPISIYSLSSGSQPYSLVTGDFNGDGYADLAVGNSSLGADGITSWIDLLLGDPANPGQFLPATRSSFALSSASDYYGYYFYLAAGDLNKDGYTDLAAAVPGSLGVLLTDSAHPGQLQAPVTYGNDALTNVSIADFNGDGWPDLLTSGNDGKVNYSGVLYGKSSNPGTFSAAIHFPRTSQISGLNSPAIVADVNRDGLPDWVVAGTQQLSGSETNEGAILLDSPSQTATTSASASAPSTSFMKGLYSGNDSYYGSYSCQINLAHPSVAQPLISGVTVTDITTNSVRISWTTNIPANGAVDYGYSSTALSYTTPWISNPTTAHTFVLSNLMPGTQYYFQARAVNFGNDCLHWTTRTTTSSFTTAIPSLPAPATTTSLTLSPASVALGNPITLTASVKSSGQPVTRGLVQFCDAAASRCENAALLGSASLDNLGSATAKLVLGPGSHQVYASFLGTLEDAASSSLPQVQTAKVQGQLDTSTTITKSGTTNPVNLTATVIALGKQAPAGNVSFVDSSSAAVLATAALGSAVQEVLFSSPLTGTGGVALDFNKDGAIDQAQIGSQGGVSVSLGVPGKPGQILRTDIYVPGVALMGLTSGDLNGDGIPDLIYAGSGYIGLLMGDAKQPGHFIPGPVYQTGGLNDILSTGDFNGDGLADVVAEDDAANNIYIYLADPAVSSGALLPPSHYYPPCCYGQIRVGDFNGDGLSDLAEIANADGSLFIQYADPTHPGTLLSAVQYPGIVNSDAFGGDGFTSGDLNGDGIPDLAFGIVDLVTEAQSVEVFLSDPTHPGNFLAPGSYPYPMSNNPAIGDVNGDGVSDLVLGSPNDTVVDVLLGDPSHPGTLLNFRESPVVEVQPNYSSSLVGGIYVVQQIETAMATASHVTYPSGTTLVYAAYPGDTNYKGSQSCTISLTTTDNNCK